MKKVSVIVPVYNVEKYIQECIESIISQSYQNWELLLVDDESTDKSIEICKMYEKKDARIKLLCNSHGGVGKMRNIGVDNAVGDYITFVDSDDILAEDFLSRALLCLKNCDLYMAGMIAYSNEKELYIGSVKKSFCICSKDLSEEQRIDLLKNNYSASCCAIVYDKVLCVKNRFDENKVFGEDLVFVNNILQQDIRVFVDQEIGYKYRMRSNSLVKTVTIEKCRDIVKTYEYLFRNADEDSMPKYFKFINNRCVQDIECTEKNILESKKTLIQKYRLLKQLLENKEIQYAMRRAYSKTKLGKFTFYPSIVALRSLVKKF